MILTALSRRDRDADRDQASPSSAALQTGTTPVAIGTSAVSACRLRSAVLREQGNRPSIENKEIARKFTTLLSLYTQTSTGARYLRGKFERSQPGRNAFRSARARILLSRRDRDGDRDRASPSSAALQTGTAPVAIATSAVPVCRLQVACCENKEIGILLKTSKSALNYHVTITLMYHVILSL